MKISLFPFIYHGYSYRSTDFRVRQINCALSYRIFAAPFLYMFSRLLSKIKNSIADNQIFGCYTNNLRIRKGMKMNEQETTKKTKKYNIQEKNKKKEKRNSFL